MPLPLDQLLAPLPDSGAGENLRYSPVYDKIKEARLEEEDGENFGEWQRPRKKADFPAVIKLATEALSTKSKDLQLAVWLAEALIRKEGFPALEQSFILLRELQVRFWGVLWPQLEDGSPEFRATPQEWFVGRCDYLIKKVPLTKKGLDWFKYYDGRDTTRERAAMAGKGNEDEKRESRDRAVATREAAAQEFDEAFEATPKGFYVSALAHLNAATEALSVLESFCAEKYGKFAPGFHSLRNLLEEITLSVAGLLDRKREKEPDEASPSENITAEAREPVRAAKQAKTAPAKAPSTPTQAKLTGPEDAYSAVAHAAGFLRSLDSTSVAPYVLVRALRWGELRTAGDTLDQSLLVAPSTEIRQNIKRLFVQSDWEELLAATEAAAALPCGRAWLDLHRYAWCALHERGCAAAAKAICSELRALIEDFPPLPDTMLDDDTPAANPETKAWLEEHVTPKAASEWEDFDRVSSYRSQEHAESAANGNGADNLFESALELARNQRFPDAVEMLKGQPLREDSGRERFLRQLQISQLCLTTGQFNIAYPILRNLFAEIERRNLVEWESSSFIVQPLSLLVHCIDKTSRDADQRTQIYNLLCRLEPVEAMKLQASRKD